MMIISDAIKQIKEGQILYSYINKKKHLFRLKNDKVLVLNIDSSFYLSIEDFSTIYYNQVFEVLEDEENNEIDSKKDEEYYSMGGLKH